MLTSGSIPTTGAAGEEWKVPGWVVDGRPLYESPARVDQVIEEGTARGRTGDPEDRARWILLLARLMETLPLRDEPDLRAVLARRILTRLVVAGRGSPLTSAIVSFLNRQLDAELRSAFALEPPARRSYSDPARSKQREAAIQEMLRMLGGTPERSAAVEATVSATPIESDVEKKEPAGFGAAHLLADVLVFLDDDLRVPLIDLLQKTYGTPVDADRYDPHSFVRDRVLLARMARQLTGFTS